jgi:hypothetical protein
MSSKLFCAIYFFYIMGVSMISVPLMLFVVGIIIKGVKYLRDGVPFLIDDAFISLVIGHGIKGGVIIGLSVIILLIFKHKKINNV